MTQEESTRVAVELAEMRGEIRTGFAELSGRLDLALQRTDQTEQDVADHEKRLDALERGETEMQKRDTARLDALERGRWPLPSIAALTGVGALGLTLYQLAAR